MLVFMATRKTINISLTTQWNKFIHERVASGRYQTASEVVREGLRLLEQKDADHKAALREVRRKINIGLNQARRGELIDGETAFRDLEARSRTRRRKRA